ncbi:MAG TPA: ABC transporter ATP-binding protein [Nitrospirota bacterium]|nr:ABC transporter ATP-binding protein [Nitrospirota bacterium]
MTADALLTVEGLRTYFYSRSRRAFIRSVDGVNIGIAKGETLGVVGESGSGKSITALSVMGLVSGGPGVISGRILYANNGTQHDLLGELGRYAVIEKQDGLIVEVKKNVAAWERRIEEIMAGIRGREIAMIFQNPKSSLNPFITIGRQITESIRLHTGVKNEKEAKDRALSWLDRVKIDSPRLRFDNHPYGLSGGMCQRVMVAMALASEPSLLIADEPTTGLDATIQAKIVDLLAQLKSELGTAIMLISHDIGIIGRLADSVAVMYGGTVVESGPARDLLGRDASSKHPYTSALMASVPSEKNIRQKKVLRAIEGDVLDTINIPAGCRFYERCTQTTAAIREKCSEREPDLREIAPRHRVRCWLYFE